ncbi:MAG: ADP-glyceromanno-heptose 6-epimerase [Alphaproteobacteria bacterium]|jgi:ADP-L-glycero-D-manno-heptose 6-epimerase|nr:ADP-glyceromanno-heptose 6-epimerase [Alphaproteobacteria bacterium]MDP6590223.1 ADP-glyceromanno-heptose 6-epimerase [Alphaproteobacteria bacterium]MDP6817861.1 ADP-glyceromanno-heptose 6-epimerase [Alphaproteobacteria bacterium]|tara:strand:- start:1304 stop:2290 length:987 start_codon:yes stop_codon:yes gene_type:complete
MILVTGGAGFIGSNLVAGLEESGAGPLAVCDREGAGDGGRTVAKRRLAARIEPAALFSFLDEHQSEMRAVFHMGATSSTMETDAALFARNNYRLSLELWHWCARHGVRFIYASSAATYGDGALGFDDDGSEKALAALSPLNLYGRSKHLFDRRVAALLAKGAAAPPQWAGLKFFNVFGPNEYHKGNQKSVIATAYPAAARGEPVRLFKSHDPRYADGGQLRDFIWVGDCVAVMLWLLEHQEVNGLFNVGTGRARSFDDLAKALFAALERPPKIEYIDMPEAIRARYQYFTEARMARLRGAGYEQPFTSLEAGVASYVRDYLMQPDPYR